MTNDEKCKRLTHILNTVHHTFNKEKVSKSEAFSVCLKIIARMFQSNEDKQTELEEHICRAISEMIPDFQATTIVKSENIH